MDDNYVKVAAIASLAIICCFALLKGIDSVLVGAVAAIMGGIAGYTIKSKKSAE